MTAPESGRSDEAAKAGPYSIGSEVWPGTSKVIEECGELAQVLGKLIALAGQTDHWDGSDLRERLHEEIADVRAALTFFAEANRLDHYRLADRTAEKVDLFRRWHREQSAPEKTDQEVKS
jgi:NTP pyrophosphatase (non-canonical NTP hydrolase)